MMTIEKSVRITQHAYERYCERVEPIRHDELKRLLREQIQQPDRRKKDYIQLDGVWWRYEADGDTVTLYTCYGRTHIDIPQAVKWAKRHRDRIDLGVNSHAMRKG